MHMRSVSFRINPAMLEQFVGEADGVRAKFGAIEGLQHQYTGVTNDGNCLSVTIWDSVEAANGGRDRAMAVLQGLSRYLAGAPQIVEYDVSEIGK